MFKEVDLVGLDFKKYLETKNKHLILFSLLGEQKRALSIKDSESTNHDCHHHSGSMTHDLNHDTQPP